MEEVKMKLGMKGVSFNEDGRDWKLPSLLYADDLVLWLVGGGPEGDGGTVC